MWVIYPSHAGTYQIIFSSLLLYQYLEMTERLIRSV
jgi:hypothetical protein